MFKWLQRGPVDTVKEQLDEIESRGRTTIWLAHIAAFLVLVVFSMGSLVGLTGDSLNALLSQWRAGSGTNITAAIAISVSTLLVFAMDIGMYYAAMRVRIMKRRGQGDSVSLDWSVIIAVGVVEALSYAYMSYLYDHPTGVIWLLIILRALAAPALAAYLSLAETSPVGERDIVQSVERVVAHGVITEMTRIAGDTTAPLERKLALYKGARGGLDSLIEAESKTRQIGISAQPTKQLPPAHSTPETNFDLSVARVPRHPSEPIPWQEQTMPQRAVHVGNSEPDVWNWDEFDPNGDDDDDPDGSDPAASGLFHTGNSTKGRRNSREASRLGASRNGTRRGTRNQGSLAALRVKEDKETRQKNIRALLDAMLEDDPDLTANGFRTAVKRQYKVNMRNDIAKRMIAHAQRSRGWKINTDDTDQYDGYPGGYEGVDSGSNGDDFDDLGLTAELEAIDLRA